MKAVRVKKPQPVQKRIYLTGLHPTGYLILVKDNQALDVIFRIEAPSYKAGCAMVKALRDLEKVRGTIW